MRQLLHVICRHCRRANRVPEVRPAKVDAEEERSLTSRFGIGSIPTLIVLRKGRELARQSGVMGTQDIVRKILSDGYRAMYKIS